MRSAQQGCTLGCVVPAFGIYEVGNLEDCVKVCIFAWKSILQLVFMLDVKKAATYIYTRYKKETGVPIDEMKLHKLLYFAQRESIIQTGLPMFTDRFYGWKYGPVLKNVRELYKNGQFESCASSVSDVETDLYRRVFDKVFSQYASRDAISLSRLSHGELSWKNSRKGMMPWEQGDKELSVKDIYKDAERIKSRRNFLMAFRTMTPHGK